MSLRNARTSRAIILKGSAKRRIRVRIPDQSLPMSIVREELMSSGGRMSVGFCGTTESRIDSSASSREDCSGVGRRGRTLPQCHAGVPIPAKMGGVGKMKPAITMIAESGGCRAAVAPFCGATRPQNHNYQMLSERLVRSQGGRICCDFNSLSRWTTKRRPFPPIGAFQHWSRTGSGATPLVSVGANR